MQDAFEEIRPSFLASGVDITSLYQAIMTVVRFHQIDHPEAAQLDKVLARALQQARIWQIGRDAYPAMAASFFMDVAYARRVLLKEMTKDEALRLLLFLENELAIGFETMQERLSLIQSERNALLQTNSLAIGEFVAAATDFAELHRRALDAMERTRFILNAYVKHDGDVAKLRFEFDDVLFGNTWATLNGLGG